MPQKNVARNAGARTGGETENRRRLQCIVPGYRAKDYTVDLEHPDAGHDYVDIIAIHDLGGTYRNSWIFPAKSKRHSFFDELHVSFPLVRILSYQWKGDVEEAASALLSELIEDRGLEHYRNVPIFFLGHGFGGVVAKRVFLRTSSLRDSRTAIHRLNEIMKGFIFLGTRHRGHFPDWTPEVWTHNLGAISPDTLIASKKACIPQSLLTNAISQTYLTNEEFQKAGCETLASVSFYEVPNRTNSYDAVVSQEDATIVDPSAENFPIYRRHRKLNKPAHVDQLNKDGIITAISRLIARVLHSPIVSQPEVIDNREDVVTLPVTTHLRILSLDGGGVRGLWAIKILESLFEEIRKLDQRFSPDALKPCDYFDIIGGTTTGGLLAIMLGRLRMDIASCRDFYLSIMRQSFQQGPGSSLRAYADTWPPLKRFVDAWLGVPWFPSEPLEGAIKNLISSRLSMEEQLCLKEKSTSIEDAPLRSNCGVNTKTFVSATTKDSIEPSRLRTYDGARDFWPSNQDCTILEACRATMAAPLYFPPTTIGSREFFDGGMNSNNPILETTDEAFIEYSDGQHMPPFAAIVSVGTGKGMKCASGLNIWTVVKKLLHGDTEMKHSHFLRHYSYLRDSYFRFNEEGSLHSIDIADVSQLDRVQKLAHEYVSSEAGSTAIRACARRLARSGRNINYEVNLPPSPPPPPPPPPAAAFPQGPPCATVPMAHPAPH